VAGIKGSLEDMVELTVRTFGVLFSIRAYHHLEGLERWGLGVYKS
jgi:hypothetical protein